MSARLRALALACLVAMLLLQLAWHAWWLPSPTLPMALVLGVSCAPVVLALAACAFDYRFGILLGGMLGLIYFCHGVMEAWAAPSGRLLALLEAVLAVAQIMLAGAAALVEKRERRRANASAP